MIGWPSKAAMPLSRGTSWLISSSTTAPATGTSTRPVRCNRETCAACLGLGSRPDDAAPALSPIHRPPVSRRLQASRSCPSTRHTDATDLLIGPADVLAVAGHLMAVPSTQLVLLRSLSCSDQVPHRLVCGVRNPYRREVASSVAPRQILGIAPVCLHPVPGLHRHERQRSGQSERRGHLDCLTYGASRAAHAVLGRTRRRRRLPCHQAESRFAQTSGTESDTITSCVAGRTPRHHVKASAACSTSMPIPSASFPAPESRASRSSGVSPLA
jgi:hypothetical protein